MDLTIEDARRFIAETALWPTARDFLWDFAPQIHASWLEGLGLEALDETLASRLASSPRAKCFILQSLGVAPVFHVFPKDDSSRLLLLDGKTLLEICKWLGVLACAQTLRHVTAGSAVRALKAAFPGVYPEAFAFSAYFKSLKTPDTSLPEGDALADGVLATGCRILLKTVSRLDDGLLMRFRMKLPKALSALEPMDIKPSGANIPLLLKLKFPEAYALCCS